MQLWYAQWSGTHTSKRTTGIAFTNVFREETPYLCEANAVDVGPADTQWPLGLGLPYDGGDEAAHDGGRCAHTCALLRRCAGQGAVADRPRRDGAGDRCTDGFSRAIRAQSFPCRLDLI